MAKFTPNCNPTKGYDHLYESSGLNLSMAVLAGAVNLETVGTDHVPITYSDLVLDSSKCRNCPYFPSNAVENSVKPCYPWVKRIQKALRFDEWYHISPSISGADVA